MDKLKAGGLALCLVVAATLAAAPPAHAAPSSDVGSGLVPVYDPDRKASRMLSAESAADIITRYWTPARLAAAQPAPAPAAPKHTTTPDTTGRQRNLAEPVRAVGLDATDTVAFSHAEGKVFFRDPTDGRNYSCSAGTVNSGKRRLVLTAGHCVHGGKGGQWMQNWVFYPGYQSGAGPAGAFPAYQMWAKTAWTQNGNLSYDYAIVITQNNSAGMRVVDRVGGNGLTVNPGRPYVTAIAYPSNFQNGERQAYCQGQLSRRSLINGDQKLNCDMRFGASGGPWLRDYSDSTTLGYIVSNQSYSLNSDGSGPEYGPYYDEEMTSLYNSAENASP